MKVKELLKIIRTDVRCPACNRLLFKAKLKGEYSLEIKCPKCGNIVEMNSITKIDKK